METSTLKKYVDIANSTLFERSTTFATPEEVNILEQLDTVKSVRNYCLDNSSYLTRFIEYRSIILKIYMYRYVLDKFYLQDEYSELTYSNQYVTSCNVDAVMAYELFNYSLILNSDEIYASGFPITLYQDDEDGGRVFKFAPTKNVNDAMLVMDELYKKSGNTVTLDRVYSGYECILGNITSKGSTISEAICRTALEWIKRNQEKFID